MRHRADHNQAAIVRDLRELGVSVAVTSSVGFGFVDLVVGFRGRNELLEIKNASPVGWKYTPAQRRFHDTWQGTILTFDNAQAALDYFARFHGKQNELRAACR
jgi:hypothetical protein